MLIAAAGLAAAVFYFALVALVAGAILGARSAIEGGRPSRIAFVFLGFGVLGSLVAIVSYIRGPRDVLPF